jgi:polysaccharide biosynthesis transport protein
MEDFEKRAALGGSSLLTPVLVRPGHAGASRLKTAVDKTAEAPESLLLGYYRTLLRRRRAIAAFTVLGALLGFLTTVAVLPVYRARTSLDIQNLNGDFMDMKSVSATGTGESASSEAYVQTQIKLLQSETLRQRTVNAIKNSGAGEAVKRGDLFSDLKRALHLPGDRPVSRDGLVDYTARRVTVKPLGLTRLVEVTCDSWSAQFAADFCNTLTREFAQQDRDVRWNEAQRTSEWLSRQLADVRQSVAEAEKKLEASAGRDAMVLKEGGASVAEEKLRQLQSELMRAQADRVAKQAQYEISTSSPADTLPTVLDSGELRGYQEKLEDLRRQVAAKVPPLTEANPWVQHMRAQIHELETSLASQKSNVLERMRNEYEAASHREALLNAAYLAQEGRVSQEQGRQAQVEMLRREIESGQQLYQTMLQRVKEAGFAAAMQASTIRVVDAAKAPPIPIAPRRGTSTAVGLLLGLLAGVSFAFFKERTQTVLRGPGEVTRYLNLRELGVIPSAQRGLRHGYIKRLPRPARAASETSLLAAAPPPPPPAHPHRLRSKHEKAMDMAVWQDHASLVAEAYRNTTYSVLLAGKELDRAKTFVITSPGVGEGKTTVTCNLGLALAQANRRVLLIDGDLRKPRLHKAMNLENKVGLRNLLRGDLDAKLTPTEVFCQPTPVGGLFVISSGSGNEEPSGLLHSPQFRTLLERLTSEFDFVLIDSPPMLHLADARILAGMSNGVILVFRARVTDLETAAASRDLFLDDHVRVIGTILNDFDPAKEGRARYYNSYYEYQDIAAEPAGAGSAAGGSKTA